MLIGTTDGFFSTCSIQESMKRIKNAGYDCVDFGLCDFSSPDGPLMGENWRSWLKDIYKATTDAGLFIHQTHALFGHFISDFVYAPPEVIFHRNIEACAVLRSKEIVFHPVFYREVVDTIDLRKRLFDYNVKWFTELAPTAKSLGIFINLENTYDGRKQPLDPPFSTASDMISIVEELNDSIFGVCLDTGHAHIMKQDIPDMIRRFGDHLRVLHINDNFGAISPVVSDQHLYPGNGTIDFATLFKALKDSNYSGVFSLEPDEFLLRMPINIRDVAIAGGAAIVRAYALNAGFE